MNKLWSRMIVSPKTRFIILLSFGITMACANVEDNDLDPATGQGFLVYWLLSGGANSNTGGTGSGGNGCSSGYAAVRFDSYVSTSKYMYLFTGSGCTSTYYSYAYNPVTAYATDPYACQYVGTSGRTLYTAQSTAGSSCASSGLFMSSGSCYTIKVYSSSYSYVNEGTSCSN
ncbi:MAG: hypothetical protein KDK39_16680 [Leptospiraceae bacterium]|nr:hypothetical protein [Leptospiraceae bacterium]